jgi:hypothetical protein
VFKAIKPTLDNLVRSREVGEVLQRPLSGREIGEAGVTGAASALPELGPFLANSTGLPVEFGNAWVNVSYPSGCKRS